MLQHFLLPALLNCLVLLFIFNYIHMYGSVHVSASICIIRFPWSLSYSHCELLVWVLGAKLGSSAGGQRFLLLNSVL